MKRTVAFSFGAIVVQVVALLVLPIAPVIADTVTPNILIGPGGGYGWCNFTNGVTDCYSFNSYDTVVDSEATGEYGYTDSSGVTLLGHFDYKIKWSLNGHQMTAYAGLTLSGSFDPTGVQYLRAL